MFKIEQLFLFNGLDENCIKDIISVLPQPVLFKKGENIYSGKSFRHALGVFLQGSGVARSEEVLKSIFFEGSVFGAGALFGSDEFYISDIDAKTDCTVQFITEEFLQNLFEKYPVCAQNYIVFLTKKIRYLNRRIKQYTGDTAAARLYCYLCDSADSSGTVKIANMSSLAKLTKMGRTSLYRALSSLEESGAVKRCGTEIKVR